MKYMVRVNTFLWGATYTDLNWEDVIDIVQEEIWVNEHHGTNPAHELIIYDNKNNEIDRYNFYFGGIYD